MCAALPQEASCGCGLDSATLASLDCARPGIAMAEFNYQPRPQFMPYHERKQRYSVLVCHRRAGKTVALLNDIIVRALTPRADGLRQQMAYMCPTQSQARAVAWAYLKEFTLCFAKCPGFKCLEQHLTITLPDPRDVNKPGTTIMLVGAENAERLRGLFLDACVIDEGADVPEYVVTTIIRPALADRQGWLTVCGTLKSPDDYLNRTLELGQKAPLLYYSMVLRASESGILPPEELRDLQATMSEEAYQVEMECNVNAAKSGRILLPYLNPVQVTRVPYDPAGAPPITAWDLGMSDTTSIWVMQMAGREPHLLAGYEESGKGLEHFVEWLSKLPYANKFGAHLLPHDSKVRELGTGKRRIDVLRGMGMRNLKVVPKLPKDQQIEAARLLLPRCWFNEDTTAEGRKALRNYSFAFDQKRQVFSLAPLHNQHCLIAGTPVLTSRGEVPIEDVMIGDDVITPAGLGRVTFSGPVRQAEELITITLGNGRTLTGTPEHKVFTHKGLIPLHNLEIGDIMFEGKSPIWRLFKHGLKEIFLRLHALAAGR